MKYTILTVKKGFPSKGWKLNYLSTCHWASGFKNIIATQNLLFVLVQDVLTLAWVSGQVLISIPALVLMVQTLNKLDEATTVYTVWRQRLLRPLVVPTIKKFICTLNWLPLNSHSYSYSMPHKCTSTVPEDRQPLVQSFLCSNALLIFILFNIFFFCFILLFILLPSLIKY